jgi:hypothetical protein
VIYFEKTAIGISLLFSGLATILALIHSAAVVVPQLTSWSNDYPSKLFFVIFSGLGMGKDLNGFGLGWLFVLGCILSVFGLIVLGIEYFKREE